ncbi:MAG: hypothetical protein AAGD38_08175 [Acidobacteriota bacterium]
MDLHQRQLFDFLFFTAVERYSERLEQRLGGAETALAKLRSDPNGDEVRLDSFSRNFFADFLLDNLEGACFVLQALARRDLPAHAGGKVADVLQEHALDVFSSLLAAKTEEVLEQHSGYQPMSG